MPRVRTPFNYDRNAASVASGLSCSDESRTQQQFKDECDINTIVKRFGLGYEMPEGVRMPTYGDFTGIDNFHDACAAIAQAHESFDQLPAHVRAHFNNDTGRFVDFIGDDKNRDQAIQLGLVPAPVATPPAAPANPTNFTPAPVPAASPAAPAAS